MIKNNKFRGLAAAAAVAALFTAQPAAADVISINGFWGGSDSVNINFNGINWITGTAAEVHGSTSAGGFNTTNLTTGGAAFQSFCVDIFDHFSFTAVSNSTQLPATVISAQAASDLGRLFSNQDHNIAATSGNGLNEAAFQLAVWEIVNEQNPDFNYDLTTGAFQASGASQSLAQTWLAELHTPSVSGYNASIWSVNSMVSAPHFAGDFAQDVVTFTPVPEPETYAMMLVGLGLLGFSARRKSQF